jgi:hypothetical protein
MYLTNRKKAVLAAHLAALSVGGKIVISGRTNAPKYYKQQF